MNTEIKVTEIELIENGSPLKALVNLEVGPMMIKFIRLVQREGTPLRIILPSIKKGTPANWRWEPVVSILYQDLKRQIEKAILEEYHKRRSSRQ
jgi:DNA-binding cell septation regulator SpoVG